MRPAHVWLAFATCLAAVLAALVWSSATVLRLERAESAAVARAAQEENVRLALWRLDSALMPLLAQESARPHAHYAPEPATFSPLLAFLPPEVLLHFRMAPGGGVASPQVPNGPLRTEAVRRTNADTLRERARRLDALRVVLAGADLVARLPREPPAPPAPVAIAAASPPAVKVADTPLPSQKTKNVQEYLARQQTYQRANVAVPPSPPPQPQPRPVSVQEGPLMPVWVGDTLLLARRVGVGGTVHVEGCWLDWPRLRADLLTSIRDLLPAARLEPAGAARPDEERRLATLPVRLLAGEMPAAAVSGTSPVRLSLAGAWLGVLLAGAAGAALLRGVLELSERRRVFVSAVTHELRTPLTTFRLYTDMLAEGMVAGEAKRQEYVERLRGEAERLGHLVENVLFYARVESGRGGGARQTVDLRALLDEVRPRMIERAARAGLDIGWDGGASPVPVKVDPSAVEQVLLNLVDNACKYAAASTPPRIHVELETTDGRARIRVRDHGPGLSKADRRRLFRPFSKSDREAANSAPGIGLGLALSRRLARAQGGDLSLDRSGAEGASFVLSLPLAVASRAAVEPPL